MNSCIIFYHMFHQNDCVKRFERTYKKIKESKLYDHTSSINLNVVGGSKITHSTTIDSKIKITNLSNEPQGEMDTIKYLHDVCSKKEDNIPILYLHGKGVTRGNNQNVQDWVDLMEYFLIERWEDCFNKLKDYDTCGVNLNSELPSIKIHYSGNFWWSNSNYIKQLPRFDISNCTVPYTMNNPRSYCEFWLTDSNFGKHYSFHNSNVDHYCVGYGRNKYAVQ